MLADPLRSFETATGIKQLCQSADTTIVLSHLHLKHDYMIGLSSLPNILGSSNKEHADKPLEYDWILVYPSFRPNQRATKYGWRRQDHCGCRKVATHGWSDRCRAQVSKGCVEAAPIASRLDRTEIPEVESRKFGFWSCHLIPSCSHIFHVSI